MSFLENEEIYKINVSQDSLKAIARYCAGDVRKSLNTLEMCVLTSPRLDGSVIITADFIRDITAKGNFIYDKNSDEHYDTISAFQKSMKSCVDIAMQVGFPEARIPLADAVVLVCQSPKSNSAYNGINAAIADIQLGHVGKIPRHLQNVHCDGDDVARKGQFYKNPHDYEGHYVKQQYLPDELVGRQYYKRSNKNKEG